MLVLYNSDGDSSGGEKHDGKNSCRKVKDSCYFKR